MWGPWRPREGKAGHLIRAPLIKWEKESFSESRAVLATCHLTAQQGCPGDRAPAARGQPLVESRAPRQRFQALVCPADAGGAPLFLQLTTRLGARRSQVMAAAAGAPSSQRGQSFWKVVSCVCQWESVSLRSNRGDVKP